MKLIAHRGNINGPNKEKENKPEYIIEAINKGYYVEIDLWLIDDKLYLGHDNPQYVIEETFLSDIEKKQFNNSIKAVENLFAAAKKIDNTLK